MYLSQVLPRNLNTTLTSTANRLKSQHSLSLSIVDRLRALAALTPSGQ